jgi:hypothetical protein
MIMWKQRIERQGVALIVVLLALLVMGSIAGGLVVVSSNHLMHAYSGNESQEALYAARAGAYMKLGQVKNGDFSPLKSRPQDLPASGASFTSTVTVGAAAGGGGGKKKKGTGTPATFPPPNTYYVESVGTSAGGKQRRVGILAQVSLSRFTHAAFGNNQVKMRSGSYTDSYSSILGVPPDHSLATIGTNNPTKGVVIEDEDQVVIGWSNSIDVLTGKPKKKKDKDKEITLVAEANIQGPPGSTEGVVVDGKKGANKAYNGFVTGAQSANKNPVVIPSGIPIGTVGTVIDPVVSPNPSVSVTVPTSIPPGAYRDLDVMPGGVATLDVSTLPPGSEAEYVFRGINLTGGNLIVQQPPVGDPVTVKVYVDTGDGKDPKAGVSMTGSSLINPVAKPVNLQLLIAGKGKSTLEGYDDVKDGASPTAYYVVYAPDAQIKLKSGQIYGAVVANEVELDGASLVDPNKAPAVIHFDTSLLEDTGNSPNLSILSVRNY